MNSAISLRAAAEDLARRSARAASLARSDLDGLLPASMALFPRRRRVERPKFQTRKRATRWP